MVWTRVWFLSWLVFLLAMGCGYSLSSTSGSSHRSVAIPMFANATLEYALEEQLTRAIVDAFLEDNRLEVVSAEEAETVLRGSVISYERTALTYDQSEQVQEYRVVVTLELEYQEVSSGNTIWREEDFRVWASYDPSLDNPEDEEVGKERAVEKVAGEVVARTIEGW
jgi:outer membrane lipopolysaccharide assembly protein LptE/RlpB